jgi:hypothetical protein
MSIWCVHTSPRIPPPITTKKRDPE